ncbi:bifunctional diguanylate cyclase/phosphodiesterase [Mycobacterium sp. AT1]|uniref:putative bifunctional diguanylate cyclase/phosphodiesterase n=1 Tax=Mycobacterium sp. AT1 TaxID=1961706 RepID=UPI0009D309BD|nr:EAL domain-containing protein [Mycobacterium sp. AT1]OPX07535.1 GGDEF-domain containing protein [Mycobacterium sp. AT1]
MSISGGRRRLGIFVVVGALVLLNALAPYGGDVARYVALVLQSVIGAGALCCAVANVRRTSGVSRAWRILVIAAMTSWLVGEAFWWPSGGGHDGSAAPLPAVVAYFGPPILSFFAMVLLVRSSGGLTRRRDGVPHGAFALAVLDGLVAVAAFSILVFLGGLGAITTAALPRSYDEAVVAAYCVLELGVVVLAVMGATAYRRDRPYRRNFLLLAGGVVLIAGSDRFIAYLWSVGVNAPDVWGGFGNILGPLMIAFAVQALSPRDDTAASDEALDWAQLVWPYLGFLIILVLCATHLLVGLTLPTVVIWLSVAMVVLVAVRQIVAMVAARQLTRRLYEAQRRLAHQVNHDVLTGLPNRLLFGQRLEAAMHHGRFVLIFVDVDDFKEVNDQFGHAAGDELLRAVGERLLRCVGASDTLARIGGDEFAVLVENDDDPPEVVADRLRVALRDPFAVHGSSVRVRASMGLVQHGADDPAPTADDLMRQADISMYAGKRLGKNTAVVYRPASGVVVDFPSALRKADGGVPPGFSLAYQPVVRLPDRTTVAVEALARWSAPNGMQIPPATFVAVAEGAGLGGALDAMVLDLACREIQSAGLPLVIHVNVGAARLGNRGFEQQVMRTLDRHDVDPGRLVLEITETVPIVDLNEGAAAIERLSALGVHVALDDFGAGYNSLSYLHALPVDVVKLDRSLAVGDERRRTLALYRSVIGLCSALGLDVIAEGIEDEAQADTVFAAGCRLAQGYLFGRAADVGELTRL